MLEDRVKVVEKVWIVLLAATVKLADVPLMRFGSVPIWNRAHPAVPFELMLPFNTALVLVTEVAGSVVTGESCEDVHPRKLQILSHRGWLVFWNSVIAVLTTG